MDSEKLQKALNTLWERVQQRGEFPALRHALDSINTAMDDELAQNGELANAVLSDFALTQKVLRLANSAMYSPYGQNVSTVSRAIMILGSNAVSHLAISLGVLDAFGDLATRMPDGERLLARAARASAIAGEVADFQAPQSAEKARVFALMRQTGRLLAAFYFPEEWSNAQEMIQQHSVKENDACRAAIGATPMELFREAARKWMLPTELMHCADPLASSEGAAATHEDWLAALAHFAEEASELSENAHSRAQMNAVSERHAVALGLSAADLSDRAATAIATIEPATPIRKALLGKPLDADKRLRLGAEEIRQAGGQMDFQTVLQTALEHMATALGLSAGVAFARNSKTRQFNARAVLGPDATAQLSNLSFAEAFVPDVFHLPLSNGRPLFLEKAQDPRMISRLPQWHQASRPGAQSLILAPVAVRGKPVALLYGDWGQTPLASPLTGSELEGLKALLAAVDHAVEQQLSLAAAHQAAQAAQLAPASNAATRVAKHQF